MNGITKETLRAYLHDLLPPVETAAVERELRASTELQALLEEVRAGEDRGEHTIGAIWKRDHVSCPSRDQLGGYVMKALDPAVIGYIEFHLETVGCLFCQANVEDLRERQAKKKKKA